MKRKISLLIIVFTLFSLSSKVSALSCALPDLLKTRDDVQVVVAVTIIEVVDGEHMLVQVDRNYSKDSVHTELSITNDKELRTWGDSYNKGDKFIMWLTEKDGQYNLGLCSNVKIFDNQIGTLMINGEVKKNINLDSLSEFENEIIQIAKDSELDQEISPDEDGREDVHIKKYIKFSLQIVSALVILFLLKIIYKHINKRN